MQALRDDSNNAKNSAEELLDPTSEQSITPRP